jgi:lipoate-protein ligase A
MALDEAIATQVRNNNASLTTTLRLYGWQQASVTLGSLQHYIDINDDVLSTEGIPLVRRPTGGRAILHCPAKDELTYSFSAPVSNPTFSGGIFESYKLLCDAFYAAFRAIGVPVEIHTSKRAIPRGNRSPLCFASSSYGELHLSGAKVIGSAQRRWPNGMLQQGSIPLEVDHKLHSRVFDTYDKDVMPGLRSFVPEITVEKLTDALVSEFERVFSINLIDGLPSEEEESLARDLLQQKYQQGSWTHRKR